MLLRTSLPTRWRVVTKPPAPPPPTPTTGGAAVGARGEEGAARGSGSETGAGHSCLPCRIGLSSTSKPAFHCQTSGSCGHFSFFFFFFFFFRDFVFQITLFEKLNLYLTLESSCGHFSFFYFLLFFYFLRDFVFQITVYEKLNYT